MAGDAGGQEKRFAPTPRRLQKARQQGQVARSAELGPAVALIAGLMVLGVEAPTIAEGLGESMHRLWVLLPTVAAQHHAFSAAQVGQALLPLALPTAMVLCVPAVASIATGLAQTRGLLSGRALLPQGSRINPAANLGRLFSREGLMRGLIALLKLLLLLGLLALVLYGIAQSVLTVVGAPPQRFLPFFGTHLRTAALAMGGTYLAIGVLDYVLQRNRFMRQLRMSAQEMKEELKEEEGDPLLRRHRRMRQQELARLRAIAGVAKATVVVTNPTHVAVALRYRPQEGDQVPTVTAVGVDAVALAMRAAARQQGLPVVQNPPLARALYRDVRVGRAIPPKFFAAVAQVMALVMRLQGGQR